MELNNTLGSIGLAFPKEQSGIILPKENETNSMNNQLVAYSILIPTLGTIIIVTNFIVVVSSGLILKTGQQPKCTYLLLGNVAMADLVTGVAVIIGNVYPKENRTHLVCTIQIGMITSTTIASVYSVGLIAIDRFIYILHGMMYSQWVYPKRTRICIAFTWILGLIIGFLPLMGWSGDTDNGRVCWLTLVYPVELIIIITILGFIPVILIMWLYSIILIKALRKVIQLSNNEPPKEGDAVGSRLRIFRGNQASNKTQVSTIEQELAQGQEIKQEEETTNKLKKFFIKFKPKRKNQEAEQKPDLQPNKWKAIKVVMLTTGSFVCTWLPYFVACVVFVFCDFDKTPRTCQNLKYAIASPLAILGFFNSLLNPIIYAWWHNGFRNTLKKIFNKKKKAKMNQVATKGVPGRLRQMNSSSSTSSTTGSTQLSSISETPCV